MFADIAQSSALLEQMEAEDFADLLDAFRNVAREAIERHGGILARSQADGVLAVFGHPRGSEDLGRRAIEASLDIQSKILTHSVLHRHRVQAHIGVDYGDALIEMGDVMRGVLDVVGGVPTLAERLSKCADAGEIIASEAAMASAQAFLHAACRDVDIKSFGVVRVWKIEGRAPAGRRRFDAAIQRGLTPLHGRQMLLDELTKKLDQGAARATCSAVIGPAGMGKTRLLDEVAQDFARVNGRVLRGFCESYLSAEVMQPFRQIVRQVLGGMKSSTASGEDDDGLVRANAELERLGINGASRQPYVDLARGSDRDGAGSKRAQGTPVEWIAHLIDRLAQAGPLLLVLDDWQWCDDGSQAVLTAILALARPIHVLLGHRPLEGEQIVPPGTLVYPLEPVQPEAGSQMVRHLVHWADPLTASELVAYAGGNPLYLEEICHAMRDAGSVGAWRQRSGASASLSMLVQARFGRLDPQAAQVAQAAAAIGTIVPRWLLTALIGRPIGYDLLRSLASADFVFTDDGVDELQFKHGVTRDVIYGTIGSRERAKLHARIAEHLMRRQRGRNDLLEALAYHCDAAGLHASAAEYAEAAGDKALASFALDRARIQYAAAVRALDRIDGPNDLQRRQWCRVAERLGLVCVFDPLALESGIGAFERALSLAVDLADPDLVVRARYWLGYVSYAKGYVLHAIDHCQAALEGALAHGDVRLAAQVQATYGQALIAGAEYDRATPIVEAAIGTKRALLRPGSQAAIGLGYTLSCQALMLGDRGDFDMAHEIFSQANDLLDGSQHPVASSILGWQATVLLWQARWAEAELVGQRAAEISEHSRSRHLLAMHHALIAYARWNLHRDRTAIDRIVEVTRWVERRRGAFVMSLNYGFLTEGLLALGDLKSARVAAAKLHLRARAHDWLGHAMGCRALAVARAGAGDFVNADRYLTLAKRAASIRQSRHEEAANELAAAQVLGARGEREASEQLRFAALQKQAALGIVIPLSNGA